MTRTITVKATRDKQTTASDKKRPSQKLSLIFTQLDNILICYIHNVLATLRVISHLLSILQKIRQASVNTMQVQEMDQ